MSLAVPTKRLYLADSLLLSFEARVVGHGSYRGHPSLLLDQTAFYPESGGQLADRGRLAGAAVEEVQVDAQGVIHHLLEGGTSLPPLGLPVEGTVAEERRRRHMAQHTGQHLLSQALLRVAGAATHSSRLGATSCTIDVGCTHLSPAQLEEAETLVDHVVERDLPVEAWVPPPAVLSRLPLRRRPKVGQGVRVVRVDDFECVPCGGTHCTHTSQVGLLSVQSAERYKGNCRVTFVAGQPARTFHRLHFRVLRQLGQTFTCRAPDVPRAVTKLQRELEEAKDRTRHLRRQLATRHAADLAQQRESPCVATIEAGDLALLRAVAQRICAHPTSVALLAAPQGPHWSVVLARGKESSFDCGALMRRLVAATGGQGGGRKDRAEGQLPRSADWPALVQAQLSVPPAPTES